MRIKRTDQLADDLTGLRRRIEVLEIKEGRGTPDDGGGEEPPPPGSPTVTAISPSQGIPQGGTNVTITGTNFTNVTGVVFGSTPATSFQVVSPTQINATAPANLSGVPGGGGNPTPTGKFTITGDGRIEDPNGLPWVACGGNIGGVRPTGGSQTGSQVLPAKILGGVLEPNYGGGPANLPDVYNLQLYQFCYIDEDGHLSWPYMSGWMGDYADESTIRAQIEAAQAEGQVILWDIGGGDGGNLPVLNGLHTQTAQDNFFNDMVDFVDTFGFQGIAWGIEQWDGHEVPGGISSTGVVAVSRRLKAHYGPQFVVGIVSIINDFEQLTSEIGRELQRTGELDFFRFEFYNLWGWYVTGPEVINIIQQTINNIGYGFSANQFVVGHAAGLGATQGNGEPITLEDCLTSWDEAVQVYPDLRGVITYGPFTLDGEVLDYAWSAAMAERLFTGDTPSSGPGGATPGNWWYEANPAVDHTQDAENYGFNMMRLILFDGWEGDGWSYEQMRDGLFASIDAHIAKGIVVTWSLEALRGTNPTLTTVQNHYATKLQDDVVARYKSHAAGHYVWLNTLSAPYDYNNDSTWATVNSWLYSRARSQGWTHMQIVDLPGEGNDMSAAATEQFILDFMQGKTNVILGAHLYSPSGTLSVTGPQIRSRNLPLIVTEFGYAEGGSSTATDWVFASAWSGSLRFGGLMWQVAGDPDNDFTFRTGAGSAYWEATKALTALGQAMFDRGQLQLNSYDDGSSGGSGLSMEVVQDFNTGSQPSDANMVVIGGNGSGGSSGGQFHVVDGLIVDPNGSTFTPWGGVTVARPTGVSASDATYGTDSAYSYANGNATRAAADGWNTTQVRVLIPPAGSAPSTGAFYTMDGFVGRDGKRFVPIGVNGVPIADTIAPGDWWNDYGMANMNGKAAAYAALGFNFVRLNDMRDYDVKPFRDWQNGLFDVIDEYTAEGIVCMPTYHRVGAGTNPTSSQLAANSDFQNYWTEIIERYEGNPLVWVNPLNEPIGTALAQWETLANYQYSLMRSKGWTGMIVIDLPQWGQGIDVGTSRMAALLQGKENTVIGFHNYDMGNQTAAVLSAQAAGVPIIVSEYGETLGGSGHSSMVWVSDNAQTLGIGAVGWWGAGNRNDDYVLRDATGAAWYDTGVPLTDYGERLFDLAANQPVQPDLGSPSGSSSFPFTLQKSLEGLGQMLDEWTAQGIVCIVSPDITASNPPNWASVDASLKTVQQWVCANYADNPFVWLDTMGASWVAAGATGTGQWSAWNTTQTACYNDAIARGWTNMQVFTLPNYGQGIDAVANGSLFDGWLAGKGDKVVLGWYNFGSAASVEAILSLMQTIRSRKLPIICTRFGQNWNDAGPSDGGNPTTDAVGVDYTALYGQTWEDGVSTKPIVYLTFDDGPTVSLTESLIAILGSHGVKGTFFVDGINVDAHPTIAAAITAAGHGIGNHTYDHVDLTTLSSTEMRSQIDQATEAILTATGVTTRVVRPPYGYTNATVEQVIAAAGMEQVLWTHDTNDWDSGTVASITAVLNTLPTSPGSVSTVLMHDWVPETQTAINAWLAANKTKFEFRAYGLASGSGGLHTGGIALAATGPRTTANDYSWRYCTANGGVFRPWHEIAEGLNEVGRLIRDRGAQGYDIIGGGPIVNTLAAVEGTGLRALIVNGEMRANVMDDQIVMYHTADLLSTDHWVEADLLIGPTVTGQYTGLVCRIAGTSTWYAFTMAGDATRMKFQRVSNGAPNAAIYGNVPGGFAPNTTRRLRMQVRNGSITCSVDGTVVINTLDNTASSGGGTGTTGTTNGAHVFSTNFLTSGGAAPTMFSDDFEGRGRTIANGTLLDTQNSYARIDQAIPAAGFILGDESGNNYYSGVNEQGKPRFTTTAKNGTYAMRCGLVNAGAGQYGGSFYHYYADTPAPIVYFNWWYRFDAMTAQAAQNGSNPGLWLARPNWANFDAQTPHLRLSVDLTLEQGDAYGTYAMSQNTWYKMESVINGVLGTSTTTIRNAAGTLLDTIVSNWTPVGNIGFIEFGALWCDMSAFTSIGYSYWDDVQMSSQPIGTGGAGGTTAADYGLDETPEYGLHGYNIPYVITDGVAYPAAWGDGYGDCIAFPARDDIEEDHYAKALVRIGPDGITGDPLGAYVGVMVRVQPTSGSGWPIHGDPASPYAWYKMETAGYSGAMRFMKIMGGNIDYEEDIYYPIEPNTDYELYLEVRGANIIGKINGEVVYEHTDYDLTGGKPGITIYNESSQQQTVIDSFEAGDFATGGSDPPPTPDPDPEPISSGTRAGLVLMASGNGANSRIDNWRAGNFETGTGVTTPVTVSVRVSSTIGTSADTSADDYTYR